MAAQDSLRHFSKTVLINLDNRPDKLERMTARLNRIQHIGWERISAVRAEKPTPSMTIGALGLAATHVQIFQRAMAEKWESVLILEDDAVFRDDIQTAFFPMIDELERLGRSAQPWEVFFLGHRMMAPVERSPALRHIVHCQAVVQTHMMAVHNRAYDRLLYRAVEAKQPVDIAYGFAKYGIKSYCADPLLSVQEPGWSDIAECAVRSWQKCPGWTDFQKNCTDPALR